MQETLRDWLRLATKTETRMLAERAGTSVSYVVQISTGFRRCSTDLAARIESASEPITKESKGRLPRLTRTDLCRTCAACPHVKNCK